MTRILVHDPVPTMDVWDDECDEDPMGHLIDEVRVPGRIFPVSYVCSKCEFQTVFINETWFARKFYRIEEDPC